MNLNLESTLSGPLAQKKIRAALAAAVDRATDLDQAAQAIDQIPGLAVYKGGSHVAIHPRFRGKFANGSERLAIVTH